MEHDMIKALVLNFIRTTPDIHDHRFGMKSMVVLGSIVHEKIRHFKAESHDKNLYNMAELNGHARSSEEGNYIPYTVFDGYFQIRRNPQLMISEGQSYDFEANQFHRTLLVGKMAITYVLKQVQTNCNARLLYPHHTRPVDAFEKTGTDTEKVSKVIDEAARALFLKIEESA